MHPIGSATDLFGFGEFKYSTFDVLQLQVQWSGLACVGDTRACVCRCVSMVHAREFIPRHHQGRLNASEFRAAAAEHCSADWATVWFGPRSLVGIRVHHIKVAHLRFVLTGPSIYPGVTATGPPGVEWTPSVSSLHGCLHSLGRRLG
jgi:hypothetical protein